MAEIENTTHWQLKIHGDSFEKGSKYTEAILEQVPAYEPFWRAHIVPLTYRVTDGASNRYVRVNQVESLNWLADSNYAAFYHLTYCHFWRDEIGRAPRRAFPSPTEGLYCYFSHGYSLIESIHWFAHRVNQVLKNHRQQGIFDIRTEPDPYTGGKRPREIKGPALNLGAYNQFRRQVRKYRNCLVHTEPVFIQNLWIPKGPSVPSYTGLTAICKVARDQRVFNADFEPSGIGLERINRLMCAAMNQIWSRAKAALDSLAQDFETYKRNQLSTLPAYEGLTFEKIEAVRRWVPIRESEHG